MKPIFPVIQELTLLTTAGNAFPTSPLVLTKCSSTLDLPDFKAHPFSTPLEDTSKLNQPQLLLQRPMDDEWQIILTRVPSLKP